MDRRNMTDKRISTYHSARPAAPVFTVGKPVPMVRRSYDMMMYGSIIAIAISIIIIGYELIIH